MLSSFAKIISYLLHPLLMPSYGLLLFFSSDNYYSLFLNTRLKLLLLGITFLFTFLLPAMNVFFLYKTGFVRSLQMDNREERKLPYLVTCIFFSAEYYMLYDAPVPAVLKSLILGAAVTVLITFLLNLKWKVSAHMTGAGGLTGAFVLLATRSDLFYAVILLFFISGIVGASRIHLGKHKPWEVYAGFVSGFAANTGLLFYILFGN